MIKVKNNQNGKIVEFNTIKQAIEYQECLIFILGIDAEIL